MSTDFKHPLARDAKIWRSGGVKGEPNKLLVVITTLELDPGHKRHKAEKTERLTDAVRQWVTENAAVANDFVLINRPKDWGSGAE